MADFTEWVGKEVFDTEGRKVGTISDLYVEDDDSRPDWATLKSGLFGTKRHFVPVNQIQQSNEGLTIDVTEDVVKGAPGIENDSELSYEEEVRLRRYYDKASNREEVSDGHTDRNDTEGERSRDHRPVTGTAGNTGPAVNASTSANSAHNVSTATEGNNYGVTNANSAAGANQPARTDQPATNNPQNDPNHGQPRLRRYVVTENVQVSVPVQREVVELEDGTVRPVDNQDRH